MNMVQTFLDVRGFSLKEGATFLGVDHGTLGQIKRGERKCPDQITAKIAKVVLFTSSQN